MTHELKIQKQWADAKLAGEKPFEIRINDRGFQKGDIVKYKVIDPKTSKPYIPEQCDASLPGGGLVHPLELCDFIITYVIEGKEGLERGYCVFADQPVPRASAESGDALRDRAARYARVAAVKPGDTSEWLCKCADLEKKRTCPYRLIKTTGDECYNPGECKWRDKRGTAARQPAPEA